MKSIGRRILTAAFLLIFTLPIIAQDIYNSAYQGNYERVKKFLENDGTLVDSVNSNGRFALEMAAQTGQIKVVKILIEKGADVNKKGRGTTALHMACIYGGKTELIDLLLEKGADINARDANRNTPLNYALLGRQKAIAELLMDKGGELNMENQDLSDLLFVASSTGIIRIVDLLLTKEIDFKYTTQEGNTFLHSAAQGGLVKFSELLISKGLQVDAINQYGHSPLHLASASGYIEMVNLLIEKGANINFESINGKTPLHFALDNEQKETVDYLINKDANSDPYVFPEMFGDYFGLKKPGSVPEIFAPDIISVENRFEHSTAAFSPDKKEVYWSSKPDGEDIFRIYFMKMENGRWTAPELAQFSKIYNGGNPVFSQDGMKIYFTSSRPIEKDGKMKDRDIWVVERQRNKWSEPVPINPLINTDANEKMLSITNNGSLYFSRSNEIYVSRKMNGKYSEPQKLDENINTGDLESAAFVAPDEEFIILEVFSGDGYGGADLYICYKKKNGSWSERVNLGNKINGEGGERFPAVSPDRKYLFFVKMDDRSDIYWVDAKIIEELKPEDLK